MQRSFVHHICKSNVDIGLTSFKTGRVVGRHAKNNETETDRAYCYIKKSCPVDKCEQKNHETETRPRRYYKTQYETNPSRTAHCASNPVGASFLPGTK